MYFLEIPLSNVMTKDDPIKKKYARTNTMLIQLNVKQKPLENQSESENDSDKSSDN
jgi:hypothetical protein